MSLRLTTDYRVLQHITAFALAWVAASYLFVYVLRPITVPQPDPGYHVDALGKGEAAVRNLQYMSDALRGDHTIVILGSSELDPTFARHFTPTTFFPKSHLAKVMTFGRPGFETLGMYGLLYALRTHLNHGSRLVIMLSPAWFRITNLAPKTFNEDFNDNVLLQLYLSDDPRAVFHDYLISHQFEFRDMTPTQRMFLDDPDGILDWNFPGLVARTINARAYTQREKLDISLARLTGSSSVMYADSGKGKDLPWDEYEKSARDREVGIIAGNDLWVRNRYYPIYKKRRAAGITHFFPGRMNAEPEMNSLRLLLQLLSTSKVKALFVMQQVNPRVYDDVPNFYALDARIKGLCNEFGMGYMDMYAMPYQEGILGDAQHPSNYGWEEIDHEISEYFRL